MKNAIALSGVLLAFAATAITADTAAAECNCVSVAAEVAASIQADVAKADGLYMRGDFAAAAAAYLKANAKAPDPELQFAAGMALWMDGKLDDARAQLAAYVSVSGAVAFKARAQAALDEIDAGVVGTAVAGVGGAAGAAGGVVGGLGRGLGGTVRDPTGDVAGGVGAAGGIAGGAVVGVTGMVDKPKPVRVAKGAAVVLGIVAVGAIGAVGIHGLGSLKDDVEFDGKFGLGLGLSGVVVGGTAIYLWGLTAATAATASAPCLTYKGTTITPTVSGDGGGLAAFGRF
ncbi:MAG TPA: hypothetical protein VM261_27825 [Kofleriaceae bacterium]|nr:hypothetical protein [Kofleriaceae bacterium]